MLPRKNHTYDPAADKWTRIASCPNLRYPGTLAVVDGRIYVFSGMIRNIYDLSDKIDVYDSATDTWTEKKPMPNPRLSATVVRDGRIYFFGGMQPAKSERRVVGLDIVEAYDPKTELWESCGTLPIENWGPVVSYNDYVLMIGGKGVSDVHAYDLQSKKSQRAGTLPRHTSGAGFVVVKDKIYVIGGTDGPPNWTDYSYNLQGAMGHP